MDVLTQLKTGGFPMIVLFLFSVTSLGLVLHLFFGFYKKDSMSADQVFLSWDHKIGWLSHLASLSTLTGLLGTVLGIQSAFQNMQEFKEASAEVFAMGISQALITTIFGLCIAIPSLFFHHFFADILEKREFQSEQVSESSKNEQK